VAAGIFAQGQWANAGPASGESGQQLWGDGIPETAIEQTFSQGTLTWKSGPDTLSFKSE
jgi:hypothetical protein